MSISIGPLRIADPVVLAPMSGVSDLPFRRLVRRLGAGMVVSEMIASREMLRKTRESLRRAARAEGQPPHAVQLAGTDPALMAEAARLSEAEGAELIDINMGCPARKVVGTAAGSALMRDEGLALRIVEATVAAVSVPVTLKMRTGWDAASRNAPRLAAQAAAAGVRMITVHGRTRCQMFEGPVDWGFVAEVKRRVDVPVLVNGDILSASDAARALRESGADGVMIGRGCLGRPWFAGQVAAFLRGEAPAPDPEPAHRHETAEAHFEEMLAHYGRERGLRVARKHLGWYLAAAGLQRWSRPVNASEDPAQVRRLLAAAFTAAPEEAAA